jgi:DNA polymerase
MTMIIYSDKTPLRFSVGALYLLIMKTLHIDIETYSEVDLLESGLYRYASGKEFALLLFAYAIDGGEVKVIDVANGEKIPEEIISALFDDSVTKVAHNATFERICLSRYFARSMSADAWRCTMAQASRMGLPVSLCEAAKALGVDQLKDENGKRLINIFCVPQKPSKSNGMRTRITPDIAPIMWQQFKDYCAQDVRVEMAIDKATVVGRACGAFEQSIYELDARINDYGVMIDREFAEACVRLDGNIRERLLGEAKRITGLDNPMSPQQLTKWLATRGIKTYSLNAARIEEIMQRTRDIDVLRVLAIRQQLSKISTSKYNTMLAVMGDDDRARGLFQYYGTHTGRWAGRLVQMHNLPRTGDIDIPTARIAVKNWDIDAVEIEFGNVTEVLSQLIRTAFIAPRGKMLVVCDYSAIEARVLSWLACERWRIDVFRTHGKIYEATAAKLYNVSIEDIKTKDKRRDHGKVAELALGYQGGVNALTAMGADKVGLSYGQLVDTVNAWRNANPNIVKMWTKAIDVVVYCARYREVASIADNITCEMYGDTMYIALPSGRYIAYPGITYDKEGVSYEDNDRKRTKVRLYGGKIVENIVQGIARDCLAEAMLRIDAQGYRIVGHVHDEVIVEVDAEDTEAPEIIKSIFDQAPAWAPGLPLRGEGFTTQYYRK